MHIIIPNNLFFICIYTSQSDFIYHKYCLNIYLNIKKAVEGGWKKLTAIFKKKKKRGEGYNH